jgi:hypothetical protein
VSQHSISRSNRFGNLFLALVCFGAMSVLLKLANERYRLATDADSAMFANSDPLFVYWPAVAGAGLLLAGLWLLFSMIRNWNTTATVYERGVALSDPRGLRHFSWEDVGEVLQSITNVYRNGSLSQTRYVYTVRTHNGQTFTFDNRFVHIKELGEAIQSNVTALVLPRYVQALNDGQRLAFGPVSIDRQGLSTRQKSLSWDEIKAVKLHNGIMTVEQASGNGRNWAAIDVAKLPNLWAFCQILASLTTIA